MKVLSVLLLTLLWSGCGGYSAPSATPPQAGAVPLVMQLVPNAAKAGDPGFTLTVNGSSFNSDATINWNGSKQGTTFVSGGQLTSMIPASAITTAGTVQVNGNQSRPCRRGHIRCRGYGGRGFLPRELYHQPMSFTIN